MHVPSAVTSRWVSLSESCHCGRAGIHLCSRCVSCSCIEIIKRKIKKHPIMEGYIKTCLYRQFQFWCFPSNLSHTYFFLLQSHLTLLVPVLLLLCSRSQPPTSVFPSIFVFLFFFPHLFSTYSLSFTSRLIVPLLQSPPEPNNIYIARQGFSGKINIT